MQQENAAIPCDSKSFTKTTVRGVKKAFVRTTVNANKSAFQLKASMKNASVLKMQLLDSTWRIGFFPDGFFFQDEQNIGR